MKIRRYSPSFLILLGVLLATSVFIFIASAKSCIRPDDYKKLGLPVLSIETEGGKKIRSKEHYFDATYSLDAEIPFSGKCKIRGRGNSTWSNIDTAKKPYLLKLNEEQPLLGMKSAQKWVLLANATDKSFLRNEYALRLANNIWNRFDFVPKEQFITLVINGRYEGLYCLSEKVEIDKNRLPLSGDSFLAKADVHWNEPWTFISKNGSRMNIVEQDGATPFDYQSMQMTFQSIEDTITEKDPSVYRSVIDTPSFIDWYLINEFTKNHDSRFYASCYMYYDSQRKQMFMGPVWDFDISCGYTSEDGCHTPDGLVTNEGNWYVHMLKRPDFRQELRQRWIETREPLYQTINAIQAEADSLRQAVELDDRVWKSFGHRHWPNAPGWRNRKNYQSEIDYLVQFLKARYAWIDSYFLTYF